MAVMQEILYPCKFDNSRQAAMLQKSGSAGPAPLLISLHTWGGDHTQVARLQIAGLCAELGWHLMFPAFRGPNWHRDACGSDLVVSDIEDALAYALSNLEVDRSRVYLTGGSGGGHCALLMAGRRPDLWTAVSAWCPITSLQDWYRECRNHIKYSNYADNVKLSCGGNPLSDAEAMREAQIRSPRTWLANAVNRCPIDISTGIHDGHIGSVPVGHAIRAYNILALPEDGIAEKDIVYIEKNESLPPELAMEVSDPAYGGRCIYLRRQSRNVRFTLFDGGHEMLDASAVNWLARQASGQSPDWGAGKSCELNSNTELAK